jgi:dihydrofolate synthase/folylpolyglutamate synthase
MGLGRSNPDNPSSHPGEPGVGADLPPPFTARDESTRWLFSLNRFGIRPGLVRIEGLLADLGHPERKLRTLVTAGTNGKGSTTRVLSTLLQAAGYKVVSYTSPHLLKVHERILINEREVPEEDFARRVEAIKPLTEKHEASWFETLTALAVQIAVDEKADFFCCETGLGGRLDASNALPAVATLLTTVGLDHQRILGETRQEIAAEKLGLLKRDTPLFCGVDEDLRSQVFGAAVRSGSPCYFLDELARWQAANPWQGGSNTWDLYLRERAFQGLPDPGSEVLRRNEALALLALTELEPRLEMRLLPADLPGAFSGLFLPGRYQRVLRDPDWFFDTGHNTQALENLLPAFLDGPGGGRRILLYGAMYDKAVSGDLSRLFSTFDAVVGTPVSLPRSRNVEELLELLREWGLYPREWTSFNTLPPAVVAGDMGDALKGLARHLRPEDRVLVTGSCFTVAEAFYRLGFNTLDDTRGVRDAQPILAALGHDPEIKE